MCWGGVDEPSSGIQIIIAIESLLDIYCWDSGIVSDSCYCQLELSLDNF